MEVLPIMFLNIKLTLYRRLKKSKEDCKMESETGSGVGDGDHGSDSMDCGGVVAGVYNARESEPSTDEMVELLAGAIEEIRFQIGVGDGPLVKFTGEMDTGDC